MIEKPSPTRHHAPADSFDAGRTSDFPLDALPPPPAEESILKALSSWLPTVPHVRLRDPDAGTAPTEVPVMEAPSGRYLLLEEIARGGMGVILKGRDTDLGRDVAVKVLLAKAHGSADLAQRFVEEAQIAGQLQHPGVVPVYEMGQLRDQRPYFTMKLVKGRTLAALLQERKDVGQDRSRFLKNFEQVCQTLAYAHARGVIHRDLKPANVMVGAFGEVFVMDWGLAKVLAEGPAQDESRAPPQPEEGSVIRTARSTSSTEAGSVMGTPAYMPPEQALGEVERLDARADVFGLGAILCEILTGQPPYQGPDNAQVLRQAVRGDLAGAYARLDNCGADPELIQLARRCLAAEPADRPRDAAALTAELTAFLESVEARLHQAELAGAEARARTAEERKRRKLTLALAAALLLLGLVVGGAGLWIAQEQAAQERDALAQQTRLIGQIHAGLDRVSILREQARTGGGLGKWGEARALAKQTETLMGSSPVPPELQARVRTLVGELDDEEKDRQLAARLDQIQLLKAEVDERKSRFALQRALPEYAKAFAEYGLRVGQTPAAEAAALLRRRLPAQHDLVIGALDDWLVLARRFRAAEAEWLFQVADNLDSDPWRKELRTALARNNQAALERLAQAKEVNRQPPQNVLLLAQATRDKSLKRAVEMLRSAQERFPGDFWINLALAHTLVDSIRYAHGDPASYDEPIAFARAALALRPDNAQVCVVLGWALLLRGRSAEAVAVLQRAIALAPSLAAAHNALGLALQYQGRLDEAKAAYQEAITRQPELPWPRANLATVLWLEGRNDEAIAASGAAFSQEPDDPAAALNFINLGVMLMEECRFGEAAAAIRKAAALQPSLAPMSGPLLLIVTNRADEAAADATKAIARDPEDPLAHLLLAFARRQQGRFAEALTAVRRGHELAGKRPSLAVAPTARWVRDFERYVALDGKTEPRDANDRQLLKHMRLIRALAKTQK